MTRSFSCSRSRLACRVESKQRLGSFTLCSVPLVSHSHSLHFSVSTFTARSCTILKFEPFLLQFYCIFDLQTPLNLFTSASDSNLVSNKMTSFLNLCEFFSSCASSLQFIYIKIGVFAQFTFGTSSLYFCSLWPNTLCIVFHFSSIFFLLLFPPPQLIHFALLALFSHKKKKKKPREKLALKL